MLALVGSQRPNSFRAAQAPSALLQLLQLLQLLALCCFLLFNLYSTCYRCVMSQYWLVKQEPTAYSWDQFVADGKTDWTGVRNFQARNNLRSMKLVDPVPSYHSVNGKAVVGIAKVTKEAFRDP